MASRNLQLFPSCDEPRGEALSDEERRDWLRLIRTENIGPVSFHQLLAHFGSAAAALDAIPELRRRGGALRPGRLPSAREAESEMRSAGKAGVRIAALPDADYPALLRQIEAPPPVVFMKGEAALAARPGIAVVGSRAASGAGRQFAHTLAGDLGAAGVTVVSGLARGIDTAAHNGALATGTIAVLAGGIDIVYPPENAELHAAIAANGLLLSECPLRFPPRSQDFPRRNRIVSGLSLGVVVIEAAQRSGSLITARMALEQNREVFAVPGHPLDPRAIGTNELIKAGATLVTGAQDVLDVLLPHFAALGRGLREDRQAAAPDCLAMPSDAPTLQPEDRAVILEALSMTPISSDALIRLTGLNSRQVAIALLELDIAGRIERHGSQLVTLRHAA